MHSRDCGHALHICVNCVWVPCVGTGVVPVCFSWGHHVGAFSALTLALGPSIDPGNGEVHTGMSLQRAEALVTPSEAYEGNCHEYSFYRTGNEACTWPNMLLLLGHNPRAF